VADVSWEIPRTKVGNRILVVAWAVFALAAVGTGVLIYQAVAGSDGGVSAPLPTATVGPVSTGTSTPSTATSSVASSPTLKPPLLPAAAAKPTTKGAAAFLRYFFDVYNYGFHSLDTTPLAALSDTKCSFCTSAIKNVQGVADIEGRAAAGDVIVTTAVAAPGDVRKGIVVNALITQDAGTIVDGSGTVVSTVSPSAGRRIDALVRWDAKGWTLVGIDAEPAQ
jgi:hypothetical protein